MTKLHVQSFMTRRGRFIYQGMLHARAVADAPEADTFVGQLVDACLVRTDTQHEEETVLACDVEVVERGLDPCLVAMKAKVTACCQRDADEAVARGADGD